MVIVIVENTIKNRIVSEDEKSSTARDKTKRVTYAETLKKGILNNDQNISKK